MGRNLNLRGKLHGLVELLNHGRALFAYIGEERFVCVAVDLIACVILFRAVTAPLVEGLSGADDAWEVDV